MCSTIRVGHNLSYKWAHMSAQEEVLQGDLQPGNLAFDNLVARL